MVEKTNRKAKIRPQTFVEHCPQAAPQAASQQSGKKSTQHLKQQKMLIKLNELETCWLTSR